MAKTPRNRIDTSNMTDAQKVVHFANRRVPKALAAISNIGNIGRYKPSVEQQNVITDAIDKAVSEMKRKLGGETVPSGGFKL